MHELSLAAEMLHVIDGLVDDKPALRVVQVTAGPLSGVCPDALRFGFETLAREQGYTNARLQLRRDPAQCICLRCATRYETMDVHRGCTGCGSLERDIDSGAEFRMDSLEVDEREA